MRYRRLIIPGGCYFFTINLLDRQSTLLTTEFKKIKSAFMRVKQRHPFLINAIVILPDHLHMLMTLPDNDGDFSKRIGLIKNYFSHSIRNKEDVTRSRQTKRERGLWQRRFWEHHIRNDYDFAQHANYIHYNPVKHRYVLKPSDWKYSSIHRFIQRGILKPDWST